MLRKAHRRERHRVSPRTSCNADGSINIYAQHNPPDARSVSALRRYEAGCG